MRGGKDKALTIDVDELYEKYKDNIDKVSEDETIKEIIEEFNNLINTNNITSITIKPDTSNATSSELELFKDKKITQNDTGNFEPILVGIVKKFFEHKQSHEEEEIEIQIVINYTPRTGELAPLVAAAAPVKPVVAAPVKPVVEPEAAPVVEPEAAPEAPVVAEPASEQVKPEQVKPEQVKPEPVKRLLQPTLVSYQLGKTTISIRSTMESIVNGKKQKQFIQDIITHFEKVPETYPDIKIIFEATSTDGSYRLSKTFSHKIVDKDIGPIFDQIIYNLNIVNKKYFELDGGWVNKSKNITLHIQIVYNISELEMIMDNIHNLLSKHRPQYTDDDFILIENTNKILVKYFESIYTQIDRGDYYRIKKTTDKKWIELIMYLEILRCLLYIQRSILYDFRIKNDCIHPYLNKIIDEMLKKPQAFNINLLNTDQPKYQYFNPLRTNFKILYGGMGQIRHIPTCLVLRGLTKKTVNIFN